MKSKKLATLTIILFLTLIYNAQSEECCDTEVYSDCGNYCLERCPNKETPICTMLCQTGCFCKDGYKRNEQGVCVRETECTQTFSLCGKNEVRKEGNKCQERCDRALIICTEELVEGCHCKDGYLRDPKTGRCIPASQCPLFGDDLNCSRDEKYRLGNNCGERCNSTLICDKTPRYACRCKEGLKRHPIKGNCIRKKECPPCTGPYEVYKKDGNPCMDKCNKDVARCMEAHVKGCYCIDGYARDLKNNICRPFPCESCGDHAQWEVCTGACDTRCDILFHGATCDINFIKCPDACRCEKGYARQTNDTSPCIPIEDCI